MLQYLLRVISFNDTCSQTKFFPSYVFLFSSLNMLTFATFKLGIDQRYLLIPLHTVYLRFSSSGKFFRHTSIDVANSFLPSTTSSDPMLYAVS